MGKKAGKAKAYEVNESAPLQGVDSLPIPTWILLDEHLAWPAKMILSYLLYRFNMFAEVVISHSAIAVFTQSKRTLISTTITDLARKGYIILHKKSGKKNTYSIGPASLAHVVPAHDGHDSDDTRSDSELPPVPPVQIMNHSRSEYEPPPSAIQTTPVHYLNGSINKNNKKEEKEGKNGIDSPLDSFCFGNQEVDRLFAEYMQTDRWKNSDPESKSAAISFLRRLVTEDPRIAYASIEYTLQHDYTGFYDNREIRDTASKLRTMMVDSSVPSSESAHTTEPSESDEDFCFWSSGISSEFQRIVKNGWALCQELVPTDMRGLLCHARFQYDKEHKSLVIVTREEIHGALFNKDLKKYFKDLNINSIKTITDNES